MLGALSFSRLPRLPRRVSAPASPAPVEMPRKARSFLTLVEQVFAARAANQGAAQPRLRQLLVEDNRYRVHAHDLLGGADAGTATTRVRPPSLGSRIRRPCTSMRTRRRCSGREHREPSSLRDRKSTRLNSSHLVIS